MVIRKMYDKDKDSLARFLVAYWRDRGMRFSLAWAKNYLDKGMTSEMTEKRFLYLDNRNITGSVAMLKYNEGVAEIRDEIWLDDAVGSLLIEELLKYAGKKNIRKLFSLALHNKVTLYKKHGFCKEGIMKDQFKVGEDVTIMSKFL